MREQKVAKVTISLPQEILAMADRLAQERSTSRSGVIAELLEKEEKARVEALMEEGYREMAEENRHLASEVFPLASETVLRHTRWDERPDG